MGVPVEIERKLWLTAALVRAVTRKDLAAAFRGINPATMFDVERAHKWLQGRAQPRDRRIYEDWARLVDLGESADWLADCGAEEFLDRLSARHAVAREILLRRAEAFGGAGIRSRDAHGRARELVGTYVCYSHALSPYYRGRLIRGMLSIAAAPGPQQLFGTYTEALPTGPMQVEGPIIRAERAIYLDLRESPGGAQILLCLFPPTPPVSVLGGLLTGTTIIASEPQPSVTRIIMVRLSMTGSRLDPPDAYLPPDASLAADIAALGLTVATPDLVDRALATFLHGGDGGGLDQIPWAAYRSVVELFDPKWLGHALPELDRPADRQRLTG